VTITEPAIISIVSTTVPSSCPGVADGSITLTVTGGTPPYNAIWADTQNGLERTDIPDTTYSVVVTDKNGCAASKVIVVDNNVSERCLVIPTIITPNNDGVNDTWQIKNIDLFPNAEVFIFTRWGKLVFHSKNLAANPWNGTFRGSLLPTDSYHYVLHLNDGSKPRSGVISIIR
jgi:gliding motility-associated-like protein